MDTPAHELVQVPAAGAPDRQALYDQCIQARITVFVDEQHFPLEAEIKPADAVATHFLLRVAGAPAGTVRVHRPPGAAYYKLACLVVLRAHRGRGLGAALVQRAHQWARDDHARAGRAGPVAVAAHAQIHAMPFYAKLGYHAEGDEFDEDGAPHQKMVVHIAGSE